MRIYKRKRMQNKERSFVAQDDRESGAVQNDGAGQVESTVNA